jgi:5-dehydro-4-deoxyglucarate dehydratase
MPMATSLGKSGNLAPEQLKTIISSGLLSFPVTDFDQAGDFAEKSYRARLEWLAPYGARALFVAGGTGEGFSLTLEEQRRVVRAAVDVSGEATTIIAGVGGGTRVAQAAAQQAEAAGAAGILLLPHYLTEASQAGLIAHVKEVCRSVHCGVIVYNRGACRLSAESIATLADACPNLIGFKDGFGDIELLVGVRQKLGDRVAYIGGMPTAEVFATAYAGIGITVYSSAVFNFIPRTALEFHSALVNGDRRTTEALLTDFFLPYIKIRNRVPGYAVSIVKAGARIVGRSAGAVRPPLVDCSEQDDTELATLIAKLGSQ